MASPTQITVSQLFKQIGLPNAPIIIDVTTDDDFALSPYLIPTATRFDYKDITNLAPELKNKRVVIVCKKGHKLGQGAAAMLRAEGINAESLMGGNMAWQTANMPTTAFAKLQDKPKLWVTKQRPKIDRIACPWLIKRFIDRDAKFLFVEGSAVEAVGEKFNATPFDVKHVAMSHKAENCTFDAILEIYNLNFKPLQTMANIIRGADTNKHELAPEVAGLLAISLGLSRMYKDDLQQLDAGMLIYDALFRWARDATNELHDWPITSEAKRDA